MTTPWTSLRRFLLIAAVAVSVVVMHAQLAPGTSAQPAAMSMASTAITMTSVASEPGAAASHQHPAPAHSVHAGGAMCESGLPFSFVLVVGVGLLLFAVRRRRAGPTATRSWLVGRRSRWRWPAQLVDLDCLCVLRV